MSSFSPLLASGGSEAVYLFKLRNAQEWLVGGVELL